jgi:hypothetical protein
VIENVLGECLMITFGKVSKPFEELPIQNTILLRSPWFVLFEPLKRVSLWVEELTLAVARYNLAP